MREGCGCSCGLGSDGESIKDTAHSWRRLLKERMLPDVYKPTSEHSHSLKRFAQVFGKC